MNKVSFFWGFTIAVSGIMLLSLPKGFIANPAMLSMVSFLGALCALGFSMRFADEDKELTKFGLTIVLSLRWATVALVLWGLVAYCWLQTWQLHTALVVSGTLLSLVAAISPRRMYSS